MIRFDSIRVENFVLFPDLMLEFSTDRERPLTVFRGENESGKTTLMRAFLWALFGKDVLPRIPNTRHPVRPVWALPEEKVRTRVVVRFRTENERVVTHFRLTRALDTTDDGTTVGQGQEALTLHRREGDDWKEQDDELPSLLKLFRPDMQEFYFIDADKATAFVGGPEGRHSDEMMRKTVTQSIRALLGLDMMRKATERLEERHLTFSRKAGSQSANSEPQRLAEELKETQTSLEAARTRLAEFAAEESERDKMFKAAEQGFEERLSRLAGIDEKNKQYEDVTRVLNERRVRQGELTNELALRLDDERLYAALMLPVIDDVMDMLQPLKDQGYIPPNELTLLPRLLVRGRCVCGTDLSIGSASRLEVERQIEKPTYTSTQSQFLDATLETARHFGNRATGRSESSWSNDSEALEQELAGLDREISLLAEQREYLREAREKEGTGALHELKKHRDELLANLESIREHRKEAEVEMNDLHLTARSLSERIRTSTTAEKRTQLIRDCADVAEDLGRIVASAYEAIEREQMVDVSETMNRIFMDVITATADSLFTEVGVRAVTADRMTKQYELYTLEANREKPLALANGASRRAIGVAFVLALAEETRTMVPLVADSLLHAMSGSVKRKIVNYLTAGDRIGQPVLFGTRADFLDEEVSSVLKGRAGRSYTLTLEAHAGGDVVRAMPGKLPKQVVVCDCGIDEFCGACERAGDEARAAEGRLNFRDQSKLFT
jgi:DNA sulfur modification protein DndD